MLKGIILISVIFLTCQETSGPLNRYHIIKFTGTRSEINPAYVGPLFVTGGAIMDINLYDKEHQPKKIGSIEPLQIILIGDSINEIFKIKKIKAYKATKDNKNFTIFHIRAIRDTSNFEIIIDFREGPEYDRILYIYQEGKPYMMLFWKDNTKINTSKELV